jgi:hypothetical protein
LRCISPGWSICLALQIRQELAISCSAKTFVQKEK